MTDGTIGSGVGRLIVKLRAAHGAIPIEGGTVLIRPYTDGKDSPVYSLTTDESGMTGYVDLPTPPAISSLVPGTKGPVYSEYNITSSKDGYYTVENIGVPVFDGITSVQIVEMIPLTEADRNSAVPPEVRYNEQNGYRMLTSESNSNSTEVSE